MTEPAWEAVVEKVLAGLLEIVSAELLHKKIDEQAEILAARNAADAAAAVKFGRDPT